jgi:aldehyde dehydrogenase (NAD+)
VKRVALELGGKSAQIYLPDALHRAAAGAAQVVAMTAGQACVAATRMLVPEDRKDEVLDAVSAAYAGISVGPPSDQTAMMGPLITAGARERCERFVMLAEEQGGKVVVGGGRPAGLERGYYFEPTVLDLPGNDNPAAQEEIFGPVLSVIEFRDAEEAVTIANDTSYGLASSIYTNDLNVAHKVARALRAGTVSINCYSEGDFAVPFGGFKASGFGGKDKSLMAHDQYTEVKTIWIQLR